MTTRDNRRLLASLALPRTRQSATKPDQERGAKLAQEDWREAGSLAVGIDDTAILRSAPLKAMNHLDLGSGHIAPAGCMDLAVSRNAAVTPLVAT